MSDKYLLLWLEAPLQSWGHDSKFGRRDSLDFPTKSGVLGLICCARGAGGKEVEWLSAWADKDMHVMAYTHKDRAGDPLQRLPLLTDFHVVGNGYDNKDPWQSLFVPKTSDGKKAKGGGSKLTYRYYLQDMAYAVVMKAPAAMIDEAAAALQSPVWDLFLGRKSCAPTEFIFQGVFDSETLAIEASNDLASAKNRAVSFEVRQGVHEGEVLCINDIPLQFGVHKQYRDRQVTVIKAA